MTKSQLKALAGVMGYEYFEMNHFRESRCTARQYALEKLFDKMGMDSIGTYLLKVENNEWMDFSDFQPSTDLNIALPLLDAFNKKAALKDEIEVKGTAIGMWYICCDMKRHQVSTKDLALEICRAIRERL